MLEYVGESSLICTTKELNRRVNQAGSVLSAALEHKEKVLHKLQFITSGFIILINYSNSIISGKKKVKVNSMNMLAVRFPFWNTAGWCMNVFMYAFFLVLFISH